MGRHERKHEVTKTRMKTRGYERSSDYSTQQYPKQRTNTANQYEQRLKARLFKSVQNTKRNRQRFKDHYHTYKMDRFAN